MSAPQYIFTITRFQCGCVYRTVSDTAVFCPQHHSEPHHSYITQKETIYTPTTDVPDVPGLVMNPRTNQPEVLRNNGYNSIHTIVSVMDGARNEWNTPDDDQTGLCAACYIEQEDYFETGIAMCECGDDHCSYRWCGQLTGVHGFWRLHAQGRSEEVTGIAEEDIFTYGRLDQQAVTVVQAIEAERLDLVNQIDQFIQEMQSLKEQDADASDAAHPQSVYLIPWMAEDYRILREARAAGNSRQADLAKSTLTKKLARLHIIGALPSTQ